MNILTILLLVGCVLLLSTGQILFKLAAESFPKVLDWGSIFNFVINKHFILALIIYGFATILWIWLLSKIPLSRAYPFIALAFILVPIMSNFFLGEKIPVTVILGSSIIIIGLIVSVN